MYFSTDLKNQLKSFSYWNLQTFPSDTFKGRRFSNFLASCPIEEFHLKFIKKGTPQDSRNYLLSIINHSEIKQ